MYIFNVLTYIVGIDRVEYLTRKKIELTHCLGG